MTQFLSDLFRAFCFIILMTGVMLVSASVIGSVIIGIVLTLENLCPIQ